MYVKTTHPEDGAPHTLQGMFEIFASKYFF